MSALEAVPDPTEPPDPPVSPPETLRLHRLSHRVLEIEEDDGRVTEYPARAKLDVETMATFLEIEETLTSGRHPVTGQALTGRQKADYYRKAHERVVEVLRERNPEINVSFDPHELLAVMAFLCDNITVARQIADDLRRAQVPVVEADGTTDSTTGAAPGLEGPLADHSASERPSTIDSSGSENETDGQRSTGEISLGTSGSPTSPTPTEPTEPAPPQ